MLLPYDIVAFVTTMVSPSTFGFNFCYGFLLELLEELELLLNGIARLKELTLRTRDKLVSFGERMSTRIFAAYLNSIGVKARQVCLLCLLHVENYITEQNPSQLEICFLHGVRQHCFLGSIGHVVPHFWSHILILSI